MSNLSEGILFTDFYQLTMAQLYFKAGIHEQNVQFDYFFRRYPDYGGHQTGYCIFAGLESLLNWMEKTAFRKEDIEALRRQKGVSGRRLFKDNFLDWLAKSANFNSLTLQAVPEGRAVHSNTPLAVVRGPLAIAQLLETSLLNHLNYQTLIATKASRIAHSAEGRPVIDFGMRRGFGTAVNLATRAAIIGGARFSSNTGASIMLDYPPKGTHSHSMVQAFLANNKTELDAFRAYAELYPDDCILLADTINTLKSGVPNAIRVFKELKQKGHEPAGIRLDSGDLAYLSIQTHKMLNESGFPNTKIVLSNQLDEIVISAICRQIRAEAVSEKINPDKLIGRLVFGVGASLVTSKGCSALDGVYKLTATENNGEWIPALKVSESSAKVPIPGIKKVWRIYDIRNKATGDLITLNGENPLETSSLLLRHPVETETTRLLERAEIKRIEPLLVNVFESGARVGDYGNMGLIANRRIEDLERLDAGVKRLVNPHIYHVSISEALWKTKNELILRYGAMM